MGDQKDGLRGLARFSDNEGDIIWPAWRAELKQRVAFEFGKIGNQIIEGEVKESDMDVGEVTEKINALINALIPRCVVLRHERGIQAVAGIVYAPSYPRQLVTGAMPRVDLDDAPHRCLQELAGLRAL